MKLASSALRDNGYLARKLACVFALLLAVSIGYSPSSVAQKSATAPKKATTQDAAPQGAAGQKDSSSAISSSTETKTIILGDKLATIDLPPNYRFVSEELAKKFMKEQGSTGEGILGIIAPPKASQDNYFIVCRFEDVGYVKDDDADKINADDILKSYKEGTAQQNEERKEHNLPPIFVGHWAESPRYDKAVNHVIWAIEVKDEDSDKAPVVSVNYNTRILGRRGVLSLNLVTDPKDLSRDKGKVAELLTKTKFIKGQTYAEYVPGQDKLAGYGLAGLILGGGAMAAAAKFGIFGALWKWGIGILLVLKKFIIIAIAGLCAFISRLFRKKPPSGGPSAGPSAGPTDGPQ